MRAWTGPYSIKEKGRGGEMVCTRFWTRHYRDGSHSPSHWVLKNDLTELLGIQMSSLSWLLDLGRQTHLVVESGTFVLSKWMLSFICHQPRWAIKRKWEVLDLGKVWRETSPNIHLKWQDRFYLSYCSQGKRFQCRSQLNSEYSKDSWGFIASGQSEGVSGWKITKRNLMRYQG